MWVARDMDGSLWSYQNKPERIEFCWGVSLGSDCARKMQDGLLSNLKWEDEPIEVELVEVKR